MDIFIITMFIATIIVLVVYELAVLIDDNRRLQNQNTIEK